MTRVWRICKEKYLSGAFSGIGAEKTGGRWNHKGIRMIYTSSSLSLASLELFVHLEVSLIPDDLVSIAAELLDGASMERLTEVGLPENWRQYPALRATKDLGSRWIEAQTSLALAVPSAVNPEETNYLLNPGHPEMPSLRVVRSQAFHFDPRMWKGP